MSCNSVESAEAPTCNPCMNTYFIALVIGEHAVIENWFIHLSIYTETNKLYSLFFNGVVLHYGYLSQIHLVQTRMQIFIGTRFASCFDICELIL